MMRVSRRQFLARTAILGGGLMAAACGGTSSAGPGDNRLEIFSWWTSGGEVQALDALYALYKKGDPKVKIVNAALGGGAGAGGNMKAVLKTRMLGGNPPDSFQVHLGRELIDSWAVADKMETLESLYKDQGYTSVFPKGLIDIASWKGKPYSVPVNIHRANLLWYNKPLIDKVGGSPPATWDEFFQIGERLKAQGIPALGVAEAQPGSTAMLFESILIAKLGAKGWKALFDGSIKWGDKRVTGALETLKRVFDYVNSDYLSVQGADQPSLISSAKVAMIINGDWTNGLLKAKQFADYGWVPSPDTKGIYDSLSDSFGLPKGAKDRQAAMDWLKLVGGKEAQDAFNPPKGSISPRSDRDTSKYDEYQRWAVQEWKKDDIVPSLEHGAAAKESFLTDYNNILNVMATRKDVGEAQTKLVQAAQDAGFTS